MNIKIGAYFSMVVIVISLFTAIPSTTVGESRTDIVLVRMNDTDEIRNIESADINIIENYGEYILVECDPAVVSYIESIGLDVDRMDYRTKLYIKDQVFDIRDGEPDMPDELRVKDYRTGEKGLYIVHMIGPIAKSWRPTLEEMGVEVMNYMHNFAYRVRMTPEQASEVSELYFVDWVGFYHPYYKLQQNIKPGMIDIGIVSCANAESLNKVREMVPENRFIDMNDRGAIVRTFVKSEEVIHDLVKIRDVLYVSKYSEPILHSEIDSQIIGGGAWFMDDDDNPSTPYRVHGNHGAYINQRGYTGASVTIAIADTGLGDGTTPNAGHLDFTDRVIGGYSFADSPSEWHDAIGHGTHVAGSAVGDTYGGTGLVYAGHEPYYLAQGPAYESNLFAVKIFFDNGYPAFWTFFDIIEQAALNSDAYVHSNSWGRKEAEGKYTSAASEYDQGVRDADRNSVGNQPMIITVSAGNDGEDGYQTLGEPGSAKNVITVGATSSYMPDAGDYGYHNILGLVDNPDDIVSFSSRGWTPDNRVKPDLVAPGYGIVSTRSPIGVEYDHTFLYTEDARYEWMQGTSMSNPAVAGAAAVTVNWYEGNYGYRPSPAMVKALLINTANDLCDDNGNTGPIPNRDEGWGIVDISKLLFPYEPFFLTDETSIFNSSGQFNEYEIGVDRTGVPLKVTLVWTDKEAAGDTVNEPTLINDLNLEMVSPSGNVYRGNAFPVDDEGNSTNYYTSPNIETMPIFDKHGDGWDDTNNVENVYIPPDEVETGLYTVKIIAKHINDDAVNLGYNSQDYALVVSNAKREFRINDGDIYTTSRDVTLSGIPGYTSSSMNFRNDDDTDPKWRTRTHTIDSGVYDDYSDTVYTVEDKGAQNLAFEFLAGDFEDGDYLRVYDGSWTMVGEFTGYWDKEDSPREAEVTGDIAYLVIEPDGDGNTGEGFGITRYDAYSEWSPPESWSSTRSWQLSSGQGTKRVWFETWVIQATCTLDTTISYMMDQVHLSPIFLQRNG